MCTRLIAGGPQRRRRRERSTRKQLNHQRQNRSLGTAVMESTASAWRPARVLLLLLLLLLAVTRDARVVGRALRASENERPCAELVAPWTESLEPAPGGNASLPLQLRVRPLTLRPSRGVLLFPGKPLLGFIRRVYRCCQERPGCSSVKGVPGRLRGGE